MATSSSHQQKVAMYRNNVTVDNLVVEIEPNDFFQVRPRFLNTRVEDWNCRLLFFRRAVFASLAM